MKHCDTCTCEEKIQRPDGCVCNPGSWPDPDKITAVCATFKLDNEFSDLYPGSEYCVHCEHEEKCHAN